MSTTATERRVRVCAACGVPCCGTWGKDGGWLAVPCEHTSARHTFDGCDGRWITPAAAPQGAEREGA